MPTDFTVYTDPGIYIEMIDPPVNNNTGITPTVVALIGSAGDGGREVSESIVLRSQYSSTLASKGIDPFSLSLKNRFTLDQYTNAAFGTLRAKALSEATTIVVDTKEDFVLPEGVANASFTERAKVKVDSQTFTVTDVTSDANGYTFTVTPALSATLEKGSVVNLVAPYVPTIKVGTLDDAELSAQSNLTSSTDTFRILQYKNVVQRVRITDADVESTTNVAITHNAAGSAHDFTVSLVTSGVYATAAEVVEAIVEDAETLDGKVTVTRTDDGTYVDYVLALNIDAPVAITDSTDNDSVATVSEVGVSAGNFIQIDNERLYVEAVRSISSTATTEIVEFDVLRGRDGTEAVQHGKVNVYLTSGYDFYVTNTSGDDSEINGVDDLTVLSAVAGGRLAPLNSSGSVVVTAESTQVVALSTDSKQHAVEVFTDLDDIRQKYGKPTTTGDTPTITSNLTLAAQLALRNGANRVYCVAVTSNDVDGFEEALTKLAEIQDINVIVPVTAGLDYSETEDVIAKVQTFCNTQAISGNLVRAFVAVDGLVNSVAASDFVSLAAKTSDSRISLVAPSRFVLQTSAGKLSAGGPFAAAALAGLHASLESQMPLTRKQLELSVYGIEDTLTGREMLDLQSQGVLVLFTDRNGRVTVRHGLTTDMTSLYSQEISVVASRDRLRDLVYNSLQTAGILGSPITANTPELVVSTVTGALETAKRATLIFDYADVKYRVPVNNPTAIELRFAYRPTMPLNYVLIQFSIDTTSSAVTFQSITEGGV